MLSERALIMHLYCGNEQDLGAPHTSAYTFECLEGMGDKCVTDLERVIAGQTPDSIVSA